MFKRIGLIGKHRNLEAIETIKALLKFLDENHLETYLEKKTAEAVPGHGVPACELNTLAQNTDLVIVVGGDGNMLTAARELSKAQVPVLGVNRGTLGFLTDICPQSFEKEITQVLQGAYIKEQRFLLETEIFRDKEVTGAGNALNDVILSQGSMGKMIEFEVYIDDQFIYSQRSDGLITATPTGSTAYALSANGPILHPDLDAIALVPLCPHTLSSRPIVVKGSSTIKVVLSVGNEIYPRMSCDGQEHHSLAPGDTLIIKKQKELLTLIHPIDYCYYGTLRSKLQWGKKL